MPPTVLYRRRGCTLIMRGSITSSPVIAASLESGSVVAIIAAVAVLAVVVRRRGRVEVELQVSRWPVARSSLLSFSVAVLWLNRAIRGFSSRETLDWRRVDSV